MRSVEAVGSSRQSKEDATRRPSKSPTSFFTLSRKLAACVAGLIALSVGAVGWHAQHSATAQIHHAFEEEAKAGTELLAETLGWRMAGGQADRVQARLEAFAKKFSEEVSWAAVVGKDGAPIASTRAGALGEPQVGELTREALAADQRVSTDHGRLQGAPIVGPNGEGKLGALVVRWSEDALTAQIAAESNNLITMSLVIVLACSALAALVISRMAARPVRMVAQSIARMAAGEEVVLPGRERGDEIGELTRSLDAVVQGAEQARRIESAINSTSSPLMLSDLNGQIVFTNPALETALGESRSFFQAQHPGEDFSSWVGQQMDKFHGNAAHQRQLLSKLESQWSSNVRFDGREFTLVVNPIRDARGTKNGFVIQWDERTDVVKIENQLKKVISAVAEGDFTQKVTAQDDRGFTSVVAHGVNGIVAQVRDFFESLDDAIVAMAQGDLSQTIDKEFKGQLEDMRSRFNGYVLRMREILREILEAGAEVQVGAEQISTGSRDLAQRAESQAASLEETSATMEEMAATIRSNAEHAVNANATTEEAQACAERGGAVVKEAVAAMARIEGSSTSISEIISVIDSIAFQTNLLALNAAVEAARAGDAGKGFAVVASEVRSLAQRCAEAAQDVKSLIEQSTKNVSDGVSLVENTGESLTEISGVISRMAETVAAISSASREQSAGVEEIANAVSHMDEITQQNAAVADQSAGAATTMAGQAERLAQQIAFFRTGDEPQPAARKAAASKPAPVSSSAAKLPPAAEPMKAAANGDWAEF